MAKGTNTSKKIDISTHLIVVIRKRRNRLRAAATFAMRARTCAIRQAADLFMMAELAADVWGSERSPCANLDCDEITRFHRKKDTLR